MWRPAERIRYEADIGRVPTREEAERVAPLFAARRRPASRSNSAPGFPPWCRGARPRTASSPTRSIAGTSASRAGAPARSWSRPPASATCRAGRSCASGTIAIRGPEPARRGRQARERRAHAALHPAHRLPRDPPAARSGEVLRALPDGDGRASARGPRRRCSGSGGPRGASSPSAKRAGSRP